jgi:hypothetical protein
MPQVKLKTTPCNSIVKKIINEFKLEYIIKNNKYYIKSEDLENKLHFDPKNKLFIDEDDKNTQIIKKDNKQYEPYLCQDTVIEIIKKSKNHPEHYNLHKILGIDIQFKKQKEIETLAIIYKHLRHKYHIIYQYQFLEFKIDSHILIEIGSNGGLVIEVDENNHEKYTKIDNEERQSILESCGFHFLRIVPKRYTKNELIELIENEIDEVEVLYSIDINPTQLWTQLQDMSIDKDFFNFIGKSIVSNKKYCVDFDDVVKYVGYSRKNNAKRVLLENFIINVDYVKFKHNNLNNFDDIFVPSILSNQNTNIKAGILINQNTSIKALNKKEFIYMTKFAFYSFALMAQTQKGKIIKNWLVTIYHKYQELLVYTRQKMINLKNNQNDMVTQNLYDKRTNEKFKQYKIKNRRNITSLNGSLDYTRIKNKKLQNIVEYDKNQLKICHEVIGEQEIELNKCYELIDDKEIESNNRAYHINIINAILCIKDKSNSEVFNKKCDKMLLQLGTIDV